MVLPKGVTAKLESDVLHVKGSKGELLFVVGDSRFPITHVEIIDGTIKVTRREETREGRIEQGLVRALIQNMAHGVAEGYTKTLDIVGVGYKAEAKGKHINLSLGFSHPVDFPVPEGININVASATRLVITGVDKKLVGETAAKIRNFRPPEPYKGKGVRYSDEVVKRKVGKAAAGASAGGK